jgi:hypothetical protein
VFLAFAEQAAPEYQRADQVVWLDRAEREDANSLAAIAWALASGDADTAGRLGWELWLFWWSRGPHGRRPPAHGGGAAAAAVAEARWMTSNTAACMAFAQGDLDAAQRRWSAARELARSDGDPLKIAQSTAGCRPDPAGARRPRRRGGALAARAAGPGGHGPVRRLARLARARLAGHGADARRPAGRRVGTSMSRGLELARRRGDRLTAYIALYNLSQLASGLGALRPPASSCTRASG